MKSSLSTNSHYQKASKTAEQWRDLWLQKYSGVLNQQELSTKERQRYWAILKRYLETYSQNPRNIDRDSLEKYLKEQPDFHKAPLELFYQKVTFSKSHLDCISTINLPTKQPNKKNHTEIIEEFRRYLVLKNYSGRTVKNYCSIIILYLNWMNENGFSDHEKAVKEYLLYLKEIRGIAARTINLHHAALQCLYREVVKENISIESIPRMKTGGTLPKVYSQQQVQKLISAVGNAKHQLVLILAYGCGLRLEEIRTLNYTDFDFDKSLLRLKQGKDSKDRVIMLDPVIQQCVENYCISTKIKGNIFTNDSSGELLSRRTLSKIFDNACIKAGVIKLGGIHTLRLCFATHLLEQGTDLRYIQKLLGHSSSKTTEIYTHVSAKSISKIRSPIAQLDVVQKKI